MDISIAFFIGKGQRVMSMISKMPTITIDILQQQFPLSEWSRYIIHTSITLLGYAARGGMVLEMKGQMWYNNFIGDEIVDINLLRDFRYVLSHSICLTARYVADATRFISYRVLSETKNISNLQSKYIEQTLVCISKKISGS